MNIVLTGATGKLGQNIVRRLFKNNVIIIICRNKRKAMNITYDYSKNCLYYECDLSNKEDIVTCCNKIIEDVGSVEVVINNAAIDIDKPLIDTTILEFEEIINTNLSAPYFMAKCFLPNMIECRKGKFIHISSDLASEAVINSSAYSITKAGLEALSRAIAIEYGRWNITSNSIKIGGMRGYVTKIGESQNFSYKDLAYDDWKVPQSRIPLRKRGCFDDYVNMIEFLCSQRSNYITGTSIPVDGGILSQL